MSSRRDARSLFGSIVGPKGAKVEAFPCAHSLCPGTLYVGERSVAFASDDMGGAVKRTTVPLSDVSGVSDVGSDGVVVSTVSGEEHVFVGLGGDRDGARRAIESARDAAMTSLALADEDEDEAGFAPAAAPRALRRSSSLPSVRKRAVVFPEPEEQDPMSAALEDFSNLSYSIRRLKVEEAAEAKAGAAPQGGRGRVEDVSKSMAFFGEVAKKRGPAALKKDWDKLKKGKDKIISNEAFSNVKLSCDLDSFYKKFWSTSASNPISHYQRDAIKDEDIKTDEWAETLDDFTLERVIDYMHPTDAPMGPPKAHSKKSQQLQRFGEHGIALRTVTQVEDVPMADCFVLEDRILVEPSGGGVTISAQFGIRFVKSTMWKKIIQSNARKGITKWLNGYSDFVVRNA